VHTPVVLRVTDIEEPVGLVFSVVDQGPGIPPSLAANLFERGVRGHRDSGGHGLGLYVVRRVMELHGGTVAVTPNPGGGAVFRLTLPQTDFHFGPDIPATPDPDRSDG
jgi:signal transduction histidine kinase